MAGSSQARTSATASPRGLEAVPAAARPAVAAALGRGTPAHHVVDTPGGLRATNAANRLSATFGGDGAVSFRSAAKGSLGLRLTRFGRAGSLAVAPAAVPTALANKVTIDRPGLQEW